MNMKGLVVVMPVVDMFNLFLILGKIVLVVGNQIPKCSSYKSQFSKDSP